MSTAQPPPFENVVAPTAPAIEPLTEPPAESPTEPPNLTFDATLASSMNYAMHQANLPVLHDLRVTNPGAETAVDIAVTLTSSPPVFAPFTQRIAAINPGETYSLGDSPLLDPQVLLGFTERVRATLTISVSHDKQPPVSKVYALDLLPPAHWPGMAAPPELLATFVQPNATAIAGLLRAARDVLNAQTSSPSLDGYQSRDPARARAMAAAIYAAIQATGITYINPPASFERQGQKVRLPDRLSADQMGTCLDLSVLLAAAMEQAGLNPLLMLIKDHAFVGVWLTDSTLPQAASEDGRVLRKCLALRKVVVFDSSSVAAGVPFAQAMVIGQGYLNDDDNFVATVDVVAARRLGYHPTQRHRLLRQPHHRVLRQATASIQPVPLACRP